MNLTVVQHETDKTTMWHITTRDDDMSTTRKMTATLVTMHTPPHTYGQSRECGTL